MMGDGYVCVKCGYDAYHAPINSITLPERDDEMHFREYPFIRRFASPITWNTDVDAWEYFWSHAGKLLERNKYNGT